MEQSCAKKQNFRRNNLIGAENYVSNSKLFKILIPQDITFNCWQLKHRTWTTNVGNFILREFYFSVRFASIIRPTKEEVNAHLNIINNNSKINDNINNVNDNNSNISNNLWRNNIFQVRPWPEYQSNRLQPKKIGMNRSFFFGTRDEDFRDRIATKLTRKIFFGFGVNWRLTGSRRLFA